MIIKARCKAMKKQKILIVDDKKENLIALQRVLEDIDAEVIAVTSGNQALTATLDHDFSLALLDVQMPEMSGYELAEFLRGDTKTKMIPIVFLTAFYGDDQHMFKGYESGAVDYIMKPYKPEVMRGKVKGFLEIDHYRHELEIHRKNLEKLVLERTTKMEMQTRELKCLYSISSLFSEKIGSINELLQDTVDLITKGWQYADETCARIILEDTEFISKNFKNTIWKQSADIIISGKPIGSVEIYYLEEKPVYDEGSFLKEERLLINDLARKIEVMIKNKRAENEIQNINANLEQLIAERTALLEVANKELESFSYSVSHDLRAPLRHISGYAEILMNKFNSELKDDGKHYLKSIVDSAHKMAVLIEALLQLSRTGRAELKLTNSDMNNIVAEEIISINQDNPETHIEWIVEKLPSVMCDSTLIRNVWSNLLSNATKFCKKKEKTRIEIGVEEKTNEVVFFVSDNGVGFDMQYANKLFGVFQRLHSAQEFEGTGIGLANVNRIIQKHGGRVWAEGKVDQGATFYFSLPK